MGYLLLSWPGLRHGYVWQLLTFQFLHAGMLHLVFNLISLYFFGRVTEERLGQAHFLTLYFASGVAGGLLQVGLGAIWPLQFGGPVLGASAGIFGLIAAFALLEPDGIILAFFVIPLRAKYLLYIEGAVALYYMLTPSSGIAYAAHVGGMLFAIGYIKWVVRSSHVWPKWNLFQRKQRSERMLQAATIRQPLSKLRRELKVSATEELPSGEFISQEVDPILDKISASGIQSLTERERRILQAARDKMSKR
jgi:membrane associated rhomboid family serine protease